MKSIKVKEIFEIMKSSPVVKFEDFFGNSRIYKGNDKYYLVHTTEDQFNKDQEAYELDSLKEAVEALKVNIEILIDNNMYDEE